MPYRPLEDFTFITSVVRYPIVYAVKPDSPIKSFKDYIERAKANPNKVSNGIAAAGSVYHLLGKWVDNLAGTEINLVFYRGTALALQDVLGGRIDVMTDAATSVIPRIRSGQLRALAVTSPERYPLLPDVPTMAETVPGIRVEFLARTGVGTEHAEADRRSPQRRDSLGIGVARREEVGKRFWRAAGAVDAGRVSQARRRRRQAMDGNRRAQQDQHLNKTQPTLGPGGRRKLE